MVSFYWSTRSPCNAAGETSANQASYQDYPWWQYSGAWIAIFTIVLTGSTGLLWWQTRELARDARKLERPYLVAEIIDFGTKPNHDGYLKPATWHFRNSGRMLGVITRVASKIAVESGKAPITPLDQDGIGPEGFAYNVIGVGADSGPFETMETLEYPPPFREVYSFDMNIKIPLGDPRRDREKNAVYLLGFVRYEDMAKNRYVSGFCFRLYVGGCLRRNPQNGNREDYNYDRKAS